MTPQRTFHHVVGATSSFGNNSHAIEAGLGLTTAITRVEVDWPAGGTEIVEGVALDEVVVIREGEGVVSTRPRAAIPVGERADAHDHP